MDLIWLSHKLWKTKSLNFTQISMVLDREMIVNHNNMSKDWLNAFQSWENVLLCLQYRSKITSRKFVFEHIKHFKSIIQVFSSKNRLEFINRDRKNTNKMITLYFGSFVVLGCSPQIVIWDFVGVLICSPIQCALNLYHQWIINRLICSKLCQNILSFLLWYQFPSRSMKHFIHL